MNNKKGKQTIERSRKITKYWTLNRKVRHQQKYNLAKFDYGEAFKCKRWKPMAMIWDLWQKAHKCRLILLFPIQMETILQLALRGEFLYIFISIPLSQILKCVLLRYPGSSRDCKRSTWPRAVFYKSIYFLLPRCSHGWSKKLVPFKSCQNWGW